MMFNIPGFKLPSFANSRMHWSVKAAEVKRQRQIIALWMSPAKQGTAGIFELKELREKKFEFIRVRLTRSGPRKLDSDNLQSAFKAVRDEIAKQIGIDDGDKIYQFEYTQQTGPYFVGVLIEGAYK